MWQKDGQETTSSDEIRKTGRGSGKESVCFLEYDGDVMAGIRQVLRGAMKDLENEDGACRKVVDDVRTLVLIFLLPPQQPSIQA